MKHNNLSLSSDELNKKSYDGFSKSIKTLEFDKVLDILMSFCTVESVRTSVLSIRPSVSASEIRIMQKEVTDAKNILAVKGNLSFTGIKDIKTYIARIKKGATLTMAELLDVAHLLKVSASSKVYFNSLPEQNSLFGIVKNIYTNKFLEEKISTSIQSEEMVADNASPELYDIRRKKRNASNKIRESLQKLISGSDRSKYLQESIVTMRNGRYVIPVKAEYKNEIKGLVHDSSSSGATVFIEPMGVVEANNELRALEGHEIEEIAKILKQLTLECERFSSELLTTFQTLCMLDVIFAKAKMSTEYNCCEVLINDKNCLRLDMARHPLLSKDSVVPINVVMGKSFTTLVITGPNTGGKTVTLKTIGLFSLMAQSGLHIPCADGSSLPVFDAILADIGDEQSIEQSLSTFSAHMVNIVDILSKYTHHSLVLFDELGAGTDPVEGAALAQSILEKVTNMGTLCAATTHYAELKAYALETDGVTNASCEFDVETLKPTYKLTIGMPGRSNAFAIAKKLGLSGEIIKAADSKINNEARQFEGLIGKLEQDRIELESNRAAAKKLRDKAQNIFEENEKKRIEFNKKIEQETLNAQKKATELLDRARTSADFVFAQLQEIQKKKDSENFKELLEQSREDVRKALGIASVDTKIADKIEVEYVPPRDFKKGDTVIISDLGKQGEIASIDGNTATVLIGSARLKTKLKTLRLVLEDKTKQKKTNVRTPKKMMEAKSEIDVRGFIGDDAIFAVDKYLDDAVLSGLINVRIIHGKGTGALRKALWDYFKRDPRIKEYRLGVFGEGDSGVTVVTLK